MSDISSIKVPEVETPYTVKDPNAVHLSGSNVAAADFMLNLQNNAGGAIKWPSGDMTDLKRGWTAADGFTGAGIGADIPSIAAMIDAKIKGMVTAIEFTSTTSLNGRGWFVLPKAAQDADFCWIHLTAPTPDLDNYTFKSVPGDTWFGMARNWDGSPLAANSPIAGIVYCVNF